jgi:hypothetical protein
VSRIRNQPVQSLFRVVEHRLRVASRHQSSGRQIGAVGKDLGIGRECRRLAPAACSSVPEIASSASPSARVAVALNFQPSRELFIIIFIIFLGVRIVPQSEKHVVERFGRLRSVLGPGINFVVPFLDRIAHKVSCWSASCRTPARTPSPPTTCW